MDIGQKILATGILFLFTGLLAVAVRVRDDNVAEWYKITFGLFIFGGAGCTLIGALATIWF